MATPWEHKILFNESSVFGWTGLKPDELERELNTLGEQGWEAVASLVDPTTSAVGVLLKRPRG